MQYCTTSIHIQAMLLNSNPIMVFGSLHRPLVIWNWKAIAFSHTWIFGAKVRIKPTAVISIVAVEDDDTQFSSAPDSNQLIKWATITGTMLTWDTSDRVIVLGYSFLQLNDGSVTAINSMQTVDSSKVNPKNQNSGFYCFSGLGARFPLPGEEYLPWVQNGADHLGFAGGSTSGWSGLQYSA